MNRGDARWVMVAGGAWLLALVTLAASRGPARAAGEGEPAVSPGGHASPSASLTQRRAGGGNGPAWFIRSLEHPRERDERRSEILDTPVLPGSIVKAVTLVAALESGVIEPDTRHICRRVRTIDGQRFVCSHPDLKRPMTPAEALAHSCNDFFVSLAPRLPRGALNAVRMAAGLPPVSAATKLGPALVGLDGPRVTPRMLVDVLARLVGAGSDPPVRMRAETRAVLREGLAGAAAFGSASALGEKGIDALAKTGTAPMPGGGVEGLVVALVPADKPTRGIVVVAPGAAGLDAAGMAADLLTSSRVGVGVGVGVGVDAAAPPSSSADARPSSGSTIRLGVLDDNGRTRVETLPLEEYVARVLAGEGQPRAPRAAQEALAIAIRTFALANRYRHRRDGFDLCDSTHCQVARPATRATRAAADATAGQVLLSRGAPAFVFYSAWCGGRSARPSEVWPGAEDYAFEPSLEDDACKDEPEWASDIAARDLERALRAAGLRGDRLRELRILGRTTSGRVARLRVDGFRPNEIAADDLRTAVGRTLGWQYVKSTAFRLERTARGYRFTGRGFGHGVGLCVIGAGHRAEAGASSREILGFYYPGLDIGRFDGVRLTTSQATSAPVAERPAARDAPAAGGIQLALPAGEEGDRAYVMGVLRAARDDIARRAGVPPPATLRVTVHPSVDSFARATGQPWWVSAATLGTAIDLLPVRILRQQHQLERTLRHEVAHAVVDPALADRPMWVREGAAFYFASPDAPGPDIQRPACPSDAELQRPVSAGAQREAYARAEACFRKAIADGRSWRDVK